MINRPEIVAEVRAVFEHYETALRAHDISTLNQFFFPDEVTVRYGLAEQNYGFAAICTYRKLAAPIVPGRTLTNTVITTVGTEMACVSTEFTLPGTVLVGRQTQTWIRTGAGWKIIAAHVSAIPA